RPMLASVIVAAGVVLSVAALADSPGLREQNMVSLGASPFEARVGTHETRTESLDALQLPNGTDLGAGIEAVESAPATRSSFMATWESVSGSTGYLLDVSTSSSFDSFVEGYHDLDVGNVTGWVVTGLNQGTTYYYRMRPYTATELAGYSEAMEATT